MSKYCPYPDPAQVDYLNERSIVLHMRALLDLHDLLLHGLDEEMRVFRLKLLDVGWGKDRLNELFQQAAAKTRYEFLIPSADFGEQFEY